VHALNPEEYPLYRALTVRLAGPNAHRLLQQLAVDDRLHNQLLRADIDAWPTLKAAVDQATAMRASAEARRVIDGIV
jgi:hypothetical protein